VYVRTCRYAGACFANVKAVSDKYASKILLPTEACYEMTIKDSSDEHGSFLTDGTWSRGEGYAADIIGNLNAGAMGWYLARSAPMHAACACPTVRSFVGNV
jgi:hypothetical protein